MVWNSLCIPCMDSSPTMSRWSIIQSKTLYHVVVGSLFDCNFRGYRSAWQLRAPFTWFLEHSIEHAHLWHPVLSTLLKRQETRYLARQLSRKTCEGKGKPSESTASVTITRTISSHESSSLANFSPLHVSAHCLVVFVQSVQEASVRACS